MTFDFGLSFELNVAEIVSEYHEKEKIKKGSNNYWVLKALYNQHYIDNEVNRVQKPDGKYIKNTSQRVYDLKNNYGIEGIESRWVKTKEGRYKEFFIRRNSSPGTEVQNG